jgi:phospholipid/cholesterol/gamma-HCH transport system substrate-binding protein
MASLRTFRERHPARVGAIGIAVLLLLVFGAFQINALPLLGSHSYAAAFRDASGLADGNEVRVAGVKVGTVTDVGLAGPATAPYVRVRFRITGDVALGEATEAHIRIKTVLGQKYLALEPAGPGRLSPGSEIPVEHTTSPFDVLQAFKGLAAEVGQIDSAQLAQSFTVLANAFADTPADISASLQSLAKVSQAMGSRDAELRTLLDHAQAVSTVVAQRDDELQKLINDSNLLLAELARRRDALDTLLKSTDRLAVQLSGLVADNQAHLGPALAQLHGVVALLQQHRDGLVSTLNELGPFLTRAANAAGNGRWVDVYVKVVIGK